ncbi:hypothetical protein AB0D08_17730 [Kitasatospora sp. NPDC048540]|uniref:hypothetical protein n=1 Tax=unclassified Kitasatospora TaxID=2633591 RepID=UPI000A65EA0C|nr:hypothetical protein [Kitasatospora sp. MBT63]
MRFGPFRFPAQRPGHPRPATDTPTASTGGAAAAADRPGLRGLFGLIGRIAAEGGRPWL